MATFTNPDGTPAVLTPEEQAQAEAMVAAQQEPPKTLANPYKPFQFNDESGNPVQLSPQDAAAARKAGGLVDPLLDLSPEDMSELARQSPDKFNILMAFQARPDVKSDPEAVNRVAQAWKAYRDKTGILDLDLTKIPGNIWGMVKGAFQYGTSMPQPVTGVPTSWKDVITPAPVKLVKEIGDWVKAIDSGELTPDQLEKVRGFTENAYATALSLEGMARIAKSAYSKMGEEERKLHFPGMPAFVPKEDAQHDINKLFEDEALLEGTQELVAGKRELLPGLNRLTSYLESKGVGVRPEMVQEKAAGDPLTFYLFGKVFGAVSRAAPTVLSEEALAQAGAKTAAGVGAATEAVGKAGQAVIPPVAKVLPTAGAVQGGVVGGGLGHVTAGVAAGYAAGKVAAKGLLSKVPTMEALQAAGRQIAGKEAVKGPLTQLAKDVAESLPGAAYEAGKGLAADVALTLPAETPEEMQGVGIGSAFGLFGGGMRMAGHVLSGQIIGPRAQNLTKFVPSRGIFPGLDPLSDQAYQGAPEGIQVRLNALRAFLHSIFDNADTVYIPRPPEGAPDPAVPALMQLRDQRGNPIFTEEQAKIWANARGLMSQDVGGKRLVFFRDVEAAPHEVSGHGIEAVLGESMMRQMDAVIQSDPKYAQNWDALAQDYVSEFPEWAKSRMPWQDFLLWVTKRGAAEAKEKLIRDRIGEGPYTKDQANTLWNEWVSRAEGATPQEKEVNAVRTILTPDEFNDAANRAYAREIFAENAAASFEHGTAPDPAIASRIVQAVGRIVRDLGGDPLAGRKSAILGVPLSLDVIEAHRRASQQVAAGAKPVVEIPKARTTFRAGSLPSTPEQQQQAAEEARTIADAAPETPPVEGGTRSTRELLGQIAEAIAQRTGIKINYLSAPDEPAAATTSRRATRRSIIEVFRQMPAAARALWEKSFFPERVIALKNGSYQVLGWSPEVFASNAHKTALALSDIISQDPAKAGLSPYPLDPKTGSFTVDGWQQLFADTQKFVQNQMAGRTGSGIPLVVPRETGAFAPALQPGVELGQTQADFISSLYNFKLPETARVIRGKMPLSVVGAEVSEATLPGRTVEPVRPRPEFEGAAAEELGIAGEHILEVNPFRQALEQAAKDTGVPLPSLIESIQRLNLSNIKEIQHAPELPQFRGNTLALTAGFAPRGEREQALLRRAMIPQQSPEVRRLADDVFSVPAGQWRQHLIDNQGASSYPHEVGQQAKTHADLNLLRSTYETLSGLVQDAIKAGNTEMALDLGLKKQTIREAIESSTGRSMDGKEDLTPTLRSLYGPDYRPPMPGAPEAQFMSRKGEVKLEEHNDRESSFTLGDSILEVEHTPDWKQVWGKTLYVPTAERMRGVGPALIEAAFDRIPEGGTYNPGEVIGAQAESQARYLRNLSQQTGVRLGEMHVNPEATFLPSKEPRAIRAAAVKMDDGKIFEGSWHAAARWAAIDAGYRKENQIAPHTPGFVTNEGEFLTGEAAEKRARQMKQVSGDLGRLEGQRPGLHSGDLDLQFLPSNEPRAIKSAAVRDPETGELYEGRMHFMARQAALQAGLQPMHLTRLQDGFVTNEGEFLDRDQALARGREFNQIATSEQTMRSRGNAGLASEDLMTSAQQKAVWEAQFAPPLKTTDKEIGFFPIGYTETARPLTLITNAAKAVAETGVKIIPHGEKGYRDIYAFGPEGEDRGSAFSRLINPKEAVVYSVSGSKPVQDILRSELEAQIRADGLRVVSANAPEAQYIFGLEGIEKMNRREVERQRRQAEQETSRLSSYAGDPAKGLILHSAKQRSTVHLTPEESKTFLADYRAASGERAKSSVIEQYFTEGTGLGAQFAPSKKEIEKALGDIGEMNHFRWRGLVDRALAAKRIRQGDGTDPEALNRGLALQYLAEQQQTQEAQFAPEKTIVIRHGSTSMNDAKPEQDRIRGFLDIPLSKDGKAEVVKLAEKLKGSGIQTIITSDLKRARETADAVAKTTGADVVEDPGLRPWHLGPGIEGKPTKEMLPVIEKFVRDPDSVPKGGESFNTFRDRFLTSYQRIQAEHPGEKIALVTHYRGTKLLDAWREAGSTGREINVDKFVEYDDTLKPATYETVAPKAEGAEAQFMARGKEEWKLRTPRAGGGQYAAARAWIDPQGKPIQIGNELHYEWMNANPDVRKQYGIPEAHDAGEGIEAHRVALRKGFARVIYNVGSGQLTVEARVKDWPNLRESVKQLAQANIGKIDRMNVHLFDAGVTKVVDAEEQALFRYSDKEKMNHLPAISAPSEVTEMSAQASSAQYAPRRGEAEERQGQFETAGPPSKPLGRKDFIGITQNAGVVGESVDNAYEVGHSDLGYHIGTAWRYDRASGTVDWNVDPHPDEMIAVENWLSRKGAEVKKHSVLGDSPEAQFTPADLKEFNKEKTLPAALAKPGWAVLSATQESIGPHTAPENVEANKRLQEALDEAGYEYQKITGTYKGVPQGESFLVTGITPDEALKLGNQFKQESVLVPEGLLYSDRTLNPVDPKGTVVGSEAEKQDFYSTTAGGVPFSLGLDFSKKVPFEPTEKQGELLATEGGKKRLLSGAEVAQMTRAQLNEYYPEAVIPKSRKEEIPSNILGSPLAKQARSEDGAVQAFKSKLLEMAKQFQDHPAYQSGLRWYSDFVPKLKAVYGADAQIMAELLAGTSPQQRPKQNFEMAEEALNNFKAGKYDRQVAKLNEGLEKIKDGSWEAWLEEEIKSGAVKDPPRKPTEDTFVRHWYDKFDLAPRKANGALYGISSKAVLKVLARKWLESNLGLKVNQFVGNLTGTSHEATIDMWADRTMRRLGYEGFRERWRILPLNASPVSDPDFRFAQKVFRAAADELKILPDALQGGIWFAEKQLWHDNGWSPLSLGDYREEIARRELKQAPEPEAEKQPELPIVEPRPLK